MTEPDFQQPQAQEAERLAYILDVLDRVRGWTHTDEDIEFLERELIQNNRSQPWQNLSK